MDEKNFTTGLYMITALEPGNDKQPTNRVWYGIDQSSGGYPFWADSIPNAAMMTREKVSVAFNKLMDDDGEARIMFHSTLKVSAKIVEVTCTVREDLDPVATERATIIAGLSQHQRRVLGV